MIGVEPHPGLCAGCRHRQVVRTKAGSTFHLCRLHEADQRYPRYPRLPVLGCPGFAPVAPSGVAPSGGAPGGEDEAD